MISNIFETVSEIDVAPGFWEYYHLDAKALSPRDADGLTRFVSDVRSFLAPAGLLLSVGCGYGLNEILLSLLSPQLRVVGVDILDDKRSNAKIRSMRLVARGAHADHVTPVLADGAGLPFRDGSFDCALAIDSLSHADYMREDRDLEESQALLLKEMTRVIRAGGRLGVVDNSVMSPRNVMLKSGTTCHPVNPFYLRFVLKSLQYEDVHIAPYYDLTGRQDTSARLSRAVLNRFRKLGILLAPLFMLRANKKPTREIP